MTLFQLIQKLTKKEKAHVSKYLSMNKQEGNMLQLFQTINKQTVYSEPKLRKKFTHKLDNLQSQLLNKLLEALVDFSKKTPTSKPPHGLMQLEILLQKNQLTLFDKRFKKQLNSAQQTENWTQILQLLDLQLRRIKKKTVIRLQ